MIDDEPLEDLVEKLHGPGKSKPSDRNYRCPECGGEFNTWDRLDDGFKGYKQVCPFCEREKGDYETSERIEPEGRSTVQNTPRFDPRELEEFSEEELGRKVVEALFGESFVEAIDENQEELNDILEGEEE